MTRVELLPECVCILATRQTQEQRSEQLTEKDTKAMMNVVHMSVCMCVRERFTHVKQ